MTQRFTGTAPVRDRTAHLSRAAGHRTGAVPPGPVHATPIRPRRPALRGAPVSRSSPTGRRAGRSRIAPTSAGACAWNRSPEPGHGPPRPAGPGTGPAYGAGAGRVPGPRG